MCIERTCCFFGHRKVNESDLLRKIIYSTVEELIVCENVDTFLFGSKSQFDDLCYNVVTELKEKYSHIRRVYVRAEFPYINDDYKTYLLQRYEETYYPDKLIKAGKAVYVERNFEMIDNSKFCIVFFNRNYMPSTRKNNKRDILDYQPKSGTKLAFDYAKKKGLIVNNVIDKIGNKG